MTELEERVAHCDVSLYSKAHVQHDGACNRLLGDLVRLLDTHYTPVSPMWAVGRRKVMAWVKIKVGAMCGQRIGVEQMKREQER